MTITDKDRIDVLQKYSWDIKNDGTGSYIYVGPIYRAGKPWGVGKTVRDAIDDAIIATVSDEEAINE